MPPGMEDASPLLSATLSENSREQYVRAYDRYVQWCRARNFENETSGKVLFHYFETKSNFFKPSSLWSHYSMLRSMINRKRNVDIRKYHHLLALLKKKSKGYKPQKPKVLSKQHITKFLREADDRKFLMIKAGLIIGLVGGCARDELSNLRWENVNEEGNLLHVIIPTRKVKKLREFFITPGNISGVNMVQIVKKYMKLRPKQVDHGRFFVSYRQGACTRQPVGVHSFGSMPRCVASFLKLTNPEGYTGHCFKLSSKFLFEDEEESQGYIESLVEIKEEQL